MWSPRSFPFTLTRECNILEILCSTSRWRWQSLRHPVYFIFVDSLKMSSWSAAIINAWDQSCHIWPTLRHKDVVLEACSIWDVFFVFVNARIWCMSSATCWPVSENKRCLHMILWIEGTLSFLVVKLTCLWSRISLLLSWSCSLVWGCCWRKVSSNQMLRMQNLMNDSHSWQFVANIVMLLFFTGEHFIRSVLRALVQWQDWYALSRHRAWFSMHAYEFWLKHCESPFRSFLFVSPWG